MIRPWHIGATIVLTLGGCINGLPYQNEPCQEQSDCPVDSGLVCIGTSDSRRCQFVCSHDRDCPDGAGSCYRTKVKQLKICGFNDSYDQGD